MAPISAQEPECRRTRIKLVGEFLQDRPDVALAKVVEARHVALVLLEFPQHLLATLDDLTCSVSDTLVHASASVRTRLLVPPVLSALCRPSLVHAAFAPPPRTIHPQADLIGPDQHTATAYGPSLARSRASGRQCRVAKRCDVPLRPDHASHDRQRHAIQRRSDTRCRRQREPDRAQPVVPRKRLGDHSSKDPSVNPQQLESLERSGRGCVDYATGDSQVALTHQLGDGGARFALAPHPAVLEAEVPHADGCVLPMPSVSITLVSSFTVSSMISCASGGRHD